MRPDLSVIVCTYNRSESLRRTLARLARQRAEGFEYEVIVVDNNSRDDTRRVVAESQAIFSGTSQDGSTANTVVLSAAAPANDDLFNGLLVVMATGVSSGQARLITDYDGTTKVATITPPWDVIPGTGDFFGGW